MTKTPTNPAAPADLPMIAPRQALDAAIDAARLASPLIELQDGRRKVLVPHGYDLDDVSPPHLLPDHIRQKITTDDRDSLTRYVNRFRDDRSLIIADIDAGRIAAFLDWHGQNESGLKPGQAAHVATLQLRDSEEFKRWNAMEGKLHSQQDMAFFLEENVADLESPEPGVMLEICRDLEVTQGAGFKAATRLDNGDRTFTYETETKVKGEVQVPTEITLSIPLYQGEPPVTVRAKFRYRANAAGLTFGFNWHRVTYQRQAVFTEMAHKVAEDTGLPVIFGRVAG